MINDPLHTVESIVAGHKFPGIRARRTCDMTNYQNNISFNDCVILLY